MNDKTLDFDQVWPTLGLGGGETVDLGATMMPSSQDWASTIRDKLPAVVIGAATSKNSHFDVRRELGRGGMGVVHLATQIALGREVALKTTIAADAHGEDALLQEARVMGLIEHPNVVPVHLIGRDDDGRPVIVMKRVEGRTWDELLTEATTDLDQHLEILMQSCRALEYAHGIGVLHRDLKPANIMVGGFGEVYVMDWGLAVSFGGANLGLPTAAESNTVVGTPAYIAPEMTVGDGKRLGPPTDVYLLGAILFEVLTGAPPHSGRSLFEVFRSSYEGKSRTYPDHVPQELRDIAERAMALQPDDRFASVAHLREAIEGFLEHRHSVELTARSLERLKILEDGADVSAVEVYRHFGAARFGLEQAIDIWPGNEPAVAALQRALRVMFAYEVAHDNLEAATALFGDFSAPDDDARDALEGLRARLAGRAAELADLRELQRDFDADVALDAKSMAIAIFAVGWIPFIWVREWTRALGLESEAWPYFGTSTAFFPILLIITAVGWKAFKANLANRILITSMWLMWAAGYFMRAMTWVSQAPLHVGMTGELLAFAVGLLLLGFVVERRLMYAGFVFGISSIFVNVFPDNMYAVYSLGGLFASLAYAVPALVQARRRT